MLDYILFSGTYGTLKNLVKNKVHHNGGSKLRYMLSRFFVQISRRNPFYAAYAATYSTFYKKRILLILLPFHRVFRAIATGRFKAEFNTVREV